MARDETGRRATIFVIVGVLLVADFVLDEYVLPGYPITAIYAIPILLAAYCLSPRPVVVTAGLAIALNVISSYLEYTVFPVWLLRSFGLIVISAVVAAIAVLLSHQRQTIAEVSQRLQQQLRDLEAVLNATENGILMCDRHFVVRMINRRLTEWLIVDPAQIVGQPFDLFLREILAPKLANPDQFIARLVWLQEHPHEIDAAEVTQSDPERRILRFYSGPVYAHGAIIGRIIVTTDITELRRQEEERQALGQVAEALVRELTLEGIAGIVAEQAQRVLGARAVVLYLLDHQRQELRLIAHREISEQWMAIFSVIPLDAPAITAQAARTGQPVEIADFREAGQIGTFARPQVEQAGIRSVFVQPLFADDELVGVLNLTKTTPHHFTPRERELIRAFADLCTIAIVHARLYEEAIRSGREAEETRQSLQNFMMMVSHDLRGPLAVVLGYGQMLTRRSGSTRSAADQKALEGILRAAQEMQRLTQDLLDAGWIGAGRFAIQPILMDLVATVRRAAEQLQTTTAEHHIVVDAPERLEGRWDRDRISQLCTNLISNAINYSPQGGKVCLTIRHADGEAILCVSDQGVGIAPEDLQRLFQPYSRVSSERTAGGTGLGLYITKGIVEAHGGRIWVESTVGKGSSFYVALPIRSDE